MKYNQVSLALDMLKKANGIKCVLIEDDTDIEINYFDPNATIDEEIPEMVIAGDYGNIFTDDLKTCNIQDNTITTTKYKITII
jgi:hypothetical protein